jgi:hypothetical protein
MMSGEGRIIPVNRQHPDPNLELESVFRGILFALIYVFALPVGVTIFILMAAVLNLRHGSLTSMPFPDSYWKNLLSFAFRLSLIPGIVYLASRGLNQLRHRRSEKRLTLVIASLMLFSVLIVMPPKPPPRVASSGIEREPEPVKQVIYRADNRKAGAVDRKHSLNTSQLQRS